MASRCIKALNELDSISDKIFYKYSKNRLKAEVEGKVRESKSRAERNVSSQQAKSSSRRNSSNFSNPPSTTVRKKSSSSSNVTKSACSTKTPKVTPKYSRRAQTSKHHHKKASLTSTQLNNDNDSVVASSWHAPSIFGKYNPEAPTNNCNQRKWFNFEDGVNQGVIDSFACDSIKEKPLCYKVDLKESKPVPKLLHHRLEVRIGRNGQVNNEDSGIMQEISLTDEKTENNKIRPSPLSWEEQLNWKNTRVVAPRETPPERNEDQGLCETHPVIFHPEVKTRMSNTTNISNEATAAYRMYLDKRLLTSDRRNLTCKNKCITSVELQDATDEIATRKKAQDIEVFPRTKSQESDFDKMDMSNTIQNIESIYRTNSEESTKNIPLDDRVLVENPQMEEKPTDFEKMSSLLDEGTDKELEKVKINKKVSFKDEIDAVNPNNRIKIEGNPVKECEVLKEAKRPRSSRDRLQSNTSKETLSVKVEMPKRPYTAPPCSPKLPRDNMDASTTSLTNAMLSIHVPTASERDVICEIEENENTELEEPDELNDTGIEDHFSFQNGAGNTQKESNDNTVHNIRVTYSSKSAPTLRVTPKQDEPIPRSKSTINPPSKSKQYITAKLDASDSALEIPSNVPPAQALIEFRKKIRENLAKETADLQLDIQQLYLKHHSNQ